MKFHQFTFLALAFAVSFASLTAADLTPDEWRRIDTQQPLTHAENANILREYYNKQIRSSDTPMKRKVQLKWKLFDLERNLARTHQALERAKTPYYDGAKANMPEQYHSYLKENLEKDINFENPLELAFDNYNARHIINVLEINPNLGLNIDKQWLLNNIHSNDVMLAILNDKRLTFTQDEEDQLVEEWAERVNERVTGSVLFKTGRVGRKRALLKKMFHHRFKNRNSRK